MSLADLIYQHVKAMPEPLALQVLDFAAFLQSRADTAERRDLQDAQSAGLTSVWDNAEDQVWDEL